MEENSSTQKKNLLLIIGPIFGVILLGTTIFLYFFGGSSDEIDPSLVDIDEFVKENTVWNLNGDAVEGSAVAITVRFPNMNLKQVEDALERADQNVRQVDADIRNVWGKLGDDTSDLENSLRNLQGDLSTMENIYHHTEILSNSVSRGDANEESPAVRATLNKLLSTREGYIRDINTMQENIDKVLTVLEDSRNQNATIGGVREAIEELEIANKRLFEEGRSLLKTLFAFEYVYNNHRKSNADGKDIDVFYIDLQDYLYDRIIVEKSQNSFYRKKGKFDKVVTETKDRLGVLDDVVALKQKRELKLSEYNELSEHLGKLNELYSGAGVSITSNGYNAISFNNDDNWEYSVADESDNTPLVVVWRVEGTPLNSGSVLANASYELTYENEDGEELPLKSKVESEINAQ
ncbi:hypothetical protein KMW28_15480 [Flammeovirga yaeyamensis]|uniref:Uncharacterized protein n=1 Tax=Flammeovirga yaeyamensis TaxID=367791 RepID=A0AAX1N5B4_9BACT|nr:hypothetical protein [Flammeovirga yaeyamensis]MBB3698586.1 hypothetical protein [Flammeovirga yaeyamensis]NMF34065.1 hypothetical protein [Flammeovirga yaeyamensis]QWG01053.1 hypothetical protein KMW28_15480 [Flammeovirga yaeyamensis]